jgi:exodeoxyribonuclease V beta subunit
MSGEFELRDPMSRAAREGEGPLSGAEPCLPFDLMGHELYDGLTLVEASAGTGKTYSITWLVTRLILERDLEPADLLVVTFTVAATEEMKSRIRAHIAHALSRWPRVLDDALRPEEAPELRAIYDRLTPAQRAGNSARLQRAVDRFEEAQISTIHGFCS